MQIITYGTRGSMAVSGPDKVRYGGNTTSIRLISKAFGDTCLSIDAGTGFIPLSVDYLKEVDSKKIKYPNSVMLFTHYHYDHIYGVPMSPFFHGANFPITVIGHEEDRFGPADCFKQKFKKPLFPVEFESISQVVSFHKLDHPQSTVILFHPKGGYAFFRLDTFSRLRAKLAHFKIGKYLYPLEECILVRMHINNHPDRTISFSFEEMCLGGKKFVFMTDHENEDGIPNSLRQHLANADLLIIDCQYTRAQYASRVGFGHSTPDYVTTLAKESNVKTLGLTHHNTFASDLDIDNNLSEAEKHLKGSGVKVFTCADYMKIDLQLL